MRKRPLTHDDDDDDDDDNENIDDDADDGMYGRSQSTVVTY
jgi:hypothetical protein